MRPVSTADLDHAEHRDAARHAPDPEPLDPSDALGHNDAPNPSPPHVCGQDPDPWCADCGAAVSEWLRGYSRPFGKSRGAA